MDDVVGVVEGWATVDEKYGTINSGRKIVSERGVGFPEPGDDGRKAVKIIGESWGQIAGWIGEEGVQGGGVDVRDGSNRTSASK